MSNIQFDGTRWTKMSLNMEVMEPASNISKLAIHWICPHFFSNPGKYDYYD